MKEILKQIKCIKKKDFWYSILIDICFLVIVNLIGVVFGFSAKNIGINVLDILFLMYSLIVIGIYSLAKYFILKLFVKENLIGFWKFLLFNMVLIYCSAFVLIIMYTMINYFVRDDFLGYYFAIFLLVYLFFFYIFLNILQALKIIGKEITQSLKIVKINLWKSIILLVMETAILILLFFVYFAINKIFKEPKLYILLMSISVGLIIVFNALNRIIFVEKVMRT
jgi:hypothetical protein